MARAVTLASKKAARDQKRASKTPAPDAHDAPLGSLVRIPISAILVDFDWNERTGADSLAFRDADGTEGLRGVAESMATDGQDMPVFVRKNADPSSRAKHPYALVAGFRRLAALRLLVSERRKPHGVDGWDPKKPTVLAIVRELSESDARALNLRENVARENLAPPDVGHALYMHKLATLAEKRAWSAEMAARKFGLGEGRVSTFIAIFEQVDPPLTDAWRTAPVQLSVKEMRAICEFPRDNQKAEYQKAVLARARNAKYGRDGTRGSGNGKGKRDFDALDGALRRAERVGLVLGEMMRLGFDMRRPDFGPYSAELVAHSAKLSAAEVSRLTHAMNAAFQKSYVLSVIVDGAQPY